ncbi:hypothetical protein C4F49_14305 [Sphingobacterium sp. KB22]|uniref:ART-PolyVal-like domain-containing protein n=2 Tax=Sphingobacterium hungaricum TaxID=2082723 RepID=A0A928YRC9_9SPHI|nr:hypothetical protein [Sphingobacterium hungaricum]
MNYLIWNIMDANTRPKINPTMIFYHGTHAFFERFEDSFRGSNTAWDNTVHGFFFADKRENALLFGDTIITANLEVKNPLDLRLHSIFNDESQASIIWNMLTCEKIDNNTALKLIKDEISLGEIHDMYGSLHSIGAHEMMLEAGYDGIISDLGDEQIEYVVFQAMQITLLSIDREKFRGYTR